MVKGNTRQVIVVRSPDTKLFEQAVFFLREDALEKNGLSLRLLQRIVRYILEEEPDYARYMGVPQEYVMEHAVYNIGGLMGLILTWHHGGYEKSAEQMGALLYQMTQGRKQGE